MLQRGAAYVARGFSGDKTQLVPLNRLDEKVLCPGAGALDKLNASLR